MHCGQCVAVCPVGAVSVEGLQCPPADVDKLTDDARALLHTVSMRRSCRSFRPDPVNMNTLRALVDYGVWAPSGTNSQKWSFTLIADRPSMESFARSVANFYRRINRQADNPLIRLWSQLFMKDVLGRYRRRYYNQVAESLRAFDEAGEDRLFHGAAAGIVVSTTGGASCPAEDALLATQNILLAAETLKLGSCLIGFAVEAMKRDVSISRRLGIDENETVYSVIALGHPKYEWHRPSGRKAPPVRVFQT
jgi:nitroreductase